MMKKLLCTLLFTVLAVGHINAQNGDIAGRTGNSGPFEPITTSSVTPPTNTPIAIEGTDFGTVVAGQISDDPNDFEFTNNASGTFILSAEIVPGQLDASEFLLSNFTDATVSGVGDSSTFQVFFEPDAGSTGSKQAWVHVTAGSAPFGVPADDYYFLIEGNVGAAAPSITVLDNGDLALTLGAIDPFGTAVGSVETVTRQYTIQNDGTAPMTIQGITNSFGDAEFTVDLPGGTTFPFDIAIGSSFTFSVTFAPNEPDANGEPDINYFAFIAIDTQIANAPVPFDDPTDFFFQVTGTGVAPSPDMEVFGNSTLITSGDTSPTTADHTVFPSVDIAAGGVTRTFTIENNGTSDVVLTSLSPIVNITGADAADFTVTTNPTTPIIAGGSTTFVITFDPTIEGTKDATVEISNNGVDNPYIFAIQGLATTPVVSTSPLMITQYYEGAGVTEKYIEVKNISSGTVINGSYNLAVFLDGNATTTGSPNITNSAPNFAVAIPTLAAGEVALFYRSSSLPANVGAYDQVVLNTEVCSFTGNDVIVISPSSETTCYNDRIDIIGVVGATTTDWGSNKSIVKGCGTTLQPAIVYDPTNIDYDPAQFIELTVDEVDNADATMDIALGTQSFGTTTFTTAWSDGLPDRTREAIVAGAYTNSNGSISACNLTINSGASVIMDSDGAGNNYVLVTDALVNNGTFTLGDTESLTITKATGTVSGTLTKIEKTTPLNNFRDLTYWSAPVSTTIASAFAGVDPNRIWLWTTPSTPANTGNWAVASGNMDAGRGYVAEAPSTIIAGMDEQHEVTFTGTPNNGSINVTVGADLSEPNGYGGYNIIGNPYPSAIDIDIFLLDQDNDEINNGTTDATIWLWTHGTPISGGLVGEYSPADYATYNLVGGVQTSDPNGASPEPTNIIGSGQGFLVRALITGSVGFTNSMRVVGQNDTQFYKSQKNVTTEKDRIWLNFKSNDGALFNQTLIGFMEEATAGYDRGYDGLKLDGGTGLSFYSNLEDDVYAIQGFGPFNPSTEVSLGVYAAKAAMHTISIHKMEGVLVDEDIYLLDNELNIVHDLRQGDYEFEIIDAGNYKDRFTLKFNSGVLSTDDVVLNNSFIVYNQDGTLKIKAGVEISKLKVYDVMGRLLIDSEPKSIAFDVPAQNIKAGTVLILNATMKDGSSISKKAIKY